MNRQAIKKILIYCFSIALLSNVLGCDVKDNPVKQISRIGSEERDRSSRDDSNSGSGTNSNGQNQGGDQTKFVDTPLVERFLKLVAEITARSAKLNRERDRRGKLRLALGANLGEGCMQDVLVKTLEVIIDGTKLGDLDVSSHFDNSDAPPSSTGRSVFEFSFGDSTFSSVLTFSNDENINSLFSVGTRKTWIPTRRDFTIGEIQRLKVKKLNAAYEVNDLCEGGKTFSACKNIKKVTEVARYHLSSLKIKVNGELIYDRGNVGHTFANHLHSSENAKSHSLGFSDDHLSLNEAYVKMKQRDDCSALQ